MFRPAQRIRNVRKSAIRKLYDGAPAGSINLGLGEPDFQTPEIVRREAIRAINEDHIGYTSNAGLASLREKIAAYHSEGLPKAFSADSVCVTNGAEEALFAVTMAMVEPGDEVLLPDPGFLAYPALAEIAGAQASYYQMPASRRFAFDIESFSRAVTEKTKLVFLNSPANPTGRALTRECLRLIADCLAGSSAYVVSDEIYRELYFEDRPASISEFYDRVIIISGLSKMMSMTGWRLGWAVGPEEVINHITLMHQYISTCASTVSQKAALAAFSQEGRAATAAMRQELGRRRELMARAIERKLRLPYVMGEGAFYIMLDVSRFGRSEEIAWSLLRQRVITIPGSAFGFHGEGYLRLSFSIEPELIEEGINRIAVGLSD
jgi:aspartate/methionine/tyrosine aminotransferase